MCGRDRRRDLKPLVIMSFSRPEERADIKMHLLRSSVNDRPHSRYRRCAFVKERARAPRRTILYTEESRRGLSIVSLSGPRAVQEQSGATVRCGPWDLRAFVWYKNTERNQTDS